MLKESALKKWLKFEMGKINSGIVIEKKALCELAKADSHENLLDTGIN